MRVIHAIVFLMLVAALPLRAQSDSDWVQEPEPIQGGGGGIIGFGGGVSGSWAFMNYAEFNTAISAQGFPAFSSDGMFLFGGHGYAYIIIVPNLRIGGMGAGGTRQSVSGATAANGNMYSSTRLTTSFGGVTLEYVIPMRRIHIAIGGLIGGGSHTLTLTRASLDDLRWPLAGVHRDELTQSYFAYQPWLSLEWEMHPLATLALTGGWSGASLGDWTLDGTHTISGMPDFKLDRAFVRLGLTVGFFLPEY
ncbi:MAG: hypothetical protein IPP94_04375 [Ignavibacteria bacterium]|nr:hypothetical protein [Ignavibacteria bacterium]